MWNFRLISLAVMSFSNKLHFLLAVLIDTQDNKHLIIWGLLQYYMWKQKLVPKLYMGAQ